METKEFLNEIIKELNNTSSLISESEAQNLINNILESKKVFVAGAGRSGLMAKSFAMRMMHMGINAYVVGETVTPGLDKDDILIISSGSGGTKSLVSMAEKAKSIGARVALVTISPDSPIGNLSDLSVKIPAKPKEAGNDSQHKTIQPMGSLFEQSLLLFYDALILRMMDRNELDSETMFGKHANLE
ncbi:6-phospho-3-hexuloisomerase [Oceanobacillus damuensis]|uniref:6-phospho-3-hexuloisomerase n=1 Tax=Oceanobacillus damuensis TaxID=937928 RepID=UPI000834DB4D|nr:6-phospho-3-hexuloisomerase [Oceanobacillus damuensis]